MTNAATTAEGFATSEAINEVAAALAKAQGDMSPATRGSKNPFFHSTYASLADVMSACMPALNDNGIAVLQTPIMHGVKELPITKIDDNGQPITFTKSVMRVGMACRLVHASGQWIEGYCCADANGTNPQEVGSTITYLRRYMLQTMVGVAAEDDDGNAGAGHYAPQGSASPRARASKPPQQALDVKHVQLRDALRDAILQYVDGDDSRAKSVLRDITKGKTFEGFSSINGMKKDWQIEQAVSRFQELSGQTVTVAK